MVNMIFPRLNHSDELIPNSNINSLECSLKETLTLRELCFRKGWISSPLPLRKIHVYHISHTYFSLNLNGYIFYIVLFTVRIR